MAAGLDDQHAILLADLNWQLIDGFAYFAKVTRPDIAYAWLPNVLLYAPALVHDNLAIGRDVVLTSRARDVLTRAWPADADRGRSPRPAVLYQRSARRSFRPGRDSVVVVLKPVNEFTIDRDDLAGAVRLLTGGTAVVPDGDYAAIAGVAGQPPALVAGSGTPFRDTVWLDGVRVDVRMESWLDFDTIRRMGFGQVVAARHHVLIVERGGASVSPRSMSRDGSLRVGYVSANLFAPQIRYLVRP